MSINVPYKRLRARRMSFDPSMVLNSNSVVEPKSRRSAASVSLEWPFHVEQGNAPVRPLLDPEAVARDV